MLLLGITTATSITDNTTAKVVKDTNTAPHLEVQKSNEKVVENKIIKKENKNKTVKTASKTIDVTNFNTLHNALTSDEYDTLTMNIKSDITLTDNTIVNQAIKTLTINGNRKTINGNNKFQFLKTNLNSTIKINNIQITKCYAEYGGAIDNSGNLTITSSILNYNNARWDGGAILGNNSNIAIMHSNFTHNTAGWDGGAITNYYGILNINNINLNYNYAGSGGAIRNFYGILNINNANLTHNTAAYSGGAIANDNDGILNINNTNLFHNNANESGGAIYNGVSNLNIIGSNINNNTSRWRGGAIYNRGDLIIIDSNITDNTATLGGGAICHEYHTLNITDSNLNYNTAKYGGAVYSEEDYSIYYDLTITSSNLQYNTANYGGAIYVHKCNLNIENSNLTHNNATEGGAIYQGYSTLNITDSNLNYNTATDDGGAIRSLDAVNITNSNLTHNTANTGGAIWSFDNELKIINSNLICNKVKYYGGALFLNGRVGMIEIINNNFKNNMGSIGGAILHGGNNTKIINNTFTSNSVNATVLIRDSGGPLHIVGTGGAIANGESIFEVSQGKVKSYVTILKVYNVEISDNTFFNNSGENGGAVSVYGGEKINITKNLFTYNRASKNGSAIYDKEGIEPNYDYRPVRNYTFGSDLIVNSNTFKANKANMNGKAILSLKNAMIKDNKNDEISKCSSTIYTNTSYAVITKNIFYDVINVKITLQPVKGVIGETITLQATLKDTDYLLVTGGNLAFKLNGKTLRSDGRFDSNAPAMKFSVKNGIVTYTIKADLYLRNAKNLTASYSGTNIYNESKSSSVTAQIQKRNAQVTVTTTPTRTKQYETLTFKITAKDVTKNGKNNTLISDNTKVMLKVNGVTLKNNKGKTLYITLDKKAQATYKYTIPAGTGGITVSKAQRNYKVEAIFVGDNYYPGARNSTSFQVERSPTTVTITQAKVTKTNVLNVKAMLKDYKGNNLIGTNKVTIKINGKSYTKNGKPVYWTVKNGNVDLMGIQIDPKTTIKRVMLVTGERQAYTEGRTETTNILKA